jgi:hypothetical protein
MEQLLATLKALDETVKRHPFAEMNL